MEIEICFKLVTLPPRRLYLTMPDGKNNIFSENFRRNSSQDLANLAVKAFLIISHLSP